MVNISKCMLLKRSYAKDQHVPKKMLSTTLILRKTQIIITMIYLPVRGALIKKAKNSKCW